MTFYQITLVTFKYNLWKGKWVQKHIYPSTLIFENQWEAEKYKLEYMDGLKSRKVKLSPGTFEIHISTLFFNEDYSKSLKV